MKHLLFALFFFHHVVVFPASGISNVDETEPFRMRKVSLVWEKAKRMGLSEERLNGLYVELQRQDKDERKWKKEKNAGKDEDGQMEAIIRGNLLRIMDKYGIGGRNPASQENDAGEKSPLETNRVWKHSPIKDERLEKLWETAVGEGKFDKQELEDLRQELDHHHQKWQQYQDLASLVSEREDRLNDVGMQSSLDEDKLSKLQEEMSLKRHEINQNYRQLKVKVSEGPGDNEFQDYRVKDLWKRANSQGLSEKELAILKEELRHFDHKIAKHDDLQEQLDVAEDLINQGHKHIKQKHEKLSAVVKEHRRYIKKLHATLDKKIGPHNEL